MTLDHVRFKLLCGEQVNNQNTNRQNTVPLLGSLEHNRSRYITTTNSTWFWMISSALHNLPLPPPSNAHNSTHFQPINIIQNELDNTPTPHSKIYNSLLLTMGDDNVNLPPGFRFYPTDEELVVHFLQRKASRLPYRPDIIPDLDLFPYDPWDLNGKSCHSYISYSLL